MCLLNMNDCICAPPPTECIELIPLFSDNSTNIIEVDSKQSQSLKGKKKLLINDKIDDMNDEDYHGHN